MTFSSGVSRIKRVRYSMMIVDTYSMALVTTYRVRQFIISPQSANPVASEHQCLSRVPVHQIAEIQATSRELRSRLHRVSAS